MPPIQLRREHVEAMIAHARETAPEECCGLIGGVSETRAITLYRLRNVTPNPESGYEAAPEDLFAAQRQMRERCEGCWPSIIPTHAQPIQAIRNRRTARLLSFSEIPDHRSWRHTNRDQGLFHFRARAALAAG